MTNVQINISYDFKKAKNEFDTFVKQLEGKQVKLNVQGTEKLVGASKATKEFTGNVIDLTDRIRTQETAMSRLASGIAHNTVKFWEWNASIVATYGSLKLLSSGIQFTQYLDDNIRSLQMVTGGTYESTKQLTDGYIELAQQMKINAREVIDTSVELARQGLTIEQTSERMQNFIKLSKVLGESLTATTEKATAGVNGMEVSAERLGDVVSAVGDASASGGNEILSILQRSAATAKLSGLSLEQTAALGAVISEKTRLSSETIGAALNSILNKFNQVDSVTGEVNQQYGKLINRTNELGVATVDATGNLLPSGQILLNIGKKWDSMSEKQQKYLVGGVGIYQFNKLATALSNVERYQELVKVGQESAGTVQQKYQTYLEGTTAAQERATASAQKLASDVFDAQVTKAFYDAGNAVFEFMEKTDALQIALVTLGATLSALATKGVLAFTIQIAEAIPLVQKFGLVAVANLYNIEAATVSATISMGLLIGSMALVAGAFVYASSEEQKFVKTQSDLADATLNVNKQMYANQESAEKLLSTIADLTDVKKLSAEQDGRVRNVMEEINKLYPTLLANMNGEGNKIQNLITAYNNLSKAALQSQAMRLAGESIELERAIQQEATSRGPQGLAVDSGLISAPETKKSIALKSRQEANKKMLNKIASDLKNFKPITSDDLKAMNGGYKGNTFAGSGGKTGSLATEKFTSPEQLSKDRYFLLNQELDKYNVLLAKNSALQENATDLATKNKLYQEEIGLLEKKRKATESINVEQKKEQAELKKELASKGVSDPLDYNKKLNSIVDQLNATRGKGDKATHANLLTQKSELEAIFARYTKITGAISDNEIAQYKLTGEIGKTKEEIAKLFDAEIKRIESLRKTAIDDFKDSMSDAVDKIKDLSETTDKAFEKDIESKKKAMEQTKLENELLDEKIERQKILDDLAQKELTRSNILAQKNVRFLNAEGTQFTWISDPDALKKADEDITDAKDKLKEHDLESSRKLIEREKQAEIDAIEEKRKANKEYYDGKIKEMQDSSAQLIKDMEAGNVVQTETMTKFYDDMRLLDKKYADDKIATMQNAMTQINSLTTQIGVTSGGSGSPAGGTPISSSTVEAAGGMRDYLKSQGWSDSGITAAGFASGGVVGFTGTANLHGSASAPELVLNQSQIMNMGAKLGMSGSIPQVANQLYNSAKSTMSNIGKSVGDIVIGNISLPSVTNGQSLVRELQQIRITHS